MTPLLRVHDTTVRFGGTVAVDHVSLDVAPGSIVGLIGPNGAGKTTLFNVVAGIQAADTGRVELAGQDITHARPHIRAQLGLARTFQRLETFGTLTARENILVGAEAHRGWDRSVQPQAVAAELIDTLGLGPVAGRRADSLPTGTQRLIELGRALAMRPQLLLLDEASSGLSAYETEQTAELLRRLAGEGLTIVLVEHDMSFVMELCDRIAMLDRGVLVAEGTPEEVRTVPAVLEAYLGTAAGGGS
ncbi:ABC transporter ATP-binding protein [Streptomyces albipurpureus]|uniref:ABC transporter ATP-binding protein n=1 Tax=Streptomyces albipurpureus TaxID=2897419 RepID=A0ABT0UQW0_9ACTN|nr:ABC transporter ATP-binding protein [Streptomyces sp. CWNU-1]MCM2389636.1 ABC transporter ATP-binding protein [Streptomyces sp. CWNU-1]